MLIFVQTMWSKQEINADSNYVVWTSLISEVMKLRKQWQWVIMFPDAKSGYKYEDDGFFKTSQIVRVPMRVSPRRSANAMHYDANWYDALFRRFGFDCVWSHLPEISAQLRYAGRTTREEISKPTIVSQHNYVVHKTLPYDFHEQLAFAELMGALISDINIFNSDHCINMFDDNAREYLKPKVIKRIKDKSIKIPYGVAEDDLPMSKPARNPVPVIAYNHRLLTHKRYDVTFKILDELWREGIRFRLRFMNNTKERLGRWREMPWFEECLSATRPEYLKKLVECDLNVIHSVHETFCIAAAESMAMGQPLCAPNGVTFPEITDAAANKYPYLFNTNAESKDMIRRLISNKAERVKWGKVLSKHVRKEYGRRLWAKRYVELFEDLPKHKVGMSAAAQAKIDEGVKTNSGKPLHELYTWLSSPSGHVNGKHTFGTQTMSLTKLQRVVANMGHTLRLIKGEHCVFYKKGGKR